jgi:hypothetical protein
MTKRLVIAAAAAAALLCCVQCGTTAVDRQAADRSASAFATVYEVLQHPRCMNCHPAGAAPLQGDASRPHGQNVLGGPDGKGLYALKCANCHRDVNTPGANLPPGAPNWHLPHPGLPLVFEGRSAGELARQLADPAQNGNKTPEQILQHVTEDPLVLWGWDPGEGRTPVPVPHADFVAAVKAWIDGGCQVPQTSSNRR